MDNQKNFVGWDYRICTYTISGERFFGIREVFYNSNGVPNSYSPRTDHLDVSHEDEVSTIQWKLEKMQEACAKHIIDLDNFPETWQQ